MARLFENVWEEIKAKARYHMENDLVVYTLANHNPNIITGVTDAGIERISKYGASREPSLVRRSQFERIWNELAKTGEAAHREGILYLSYALLLSFIAGIGFKTHPLKLYFSDRNLAMRQFTGLGGFSTGENRDNQHGHGGEGVIHRALKESIARDPLGLLGEPLTLVQMEFEFCTRDRVDLLFQDRSGSLVCVEVEPDVKADDPEPFMQALKYRALTAMTYGTHLDSVRGLVAARSFDATGIKQWAEPYGIEVAVVALPNAALNYIIED